jgi:hypothetical protein
MTWREHTPNPNAVAGPDFRTMNKLAVTSGLTKANQLREFRETNFVRQKQGYDKVRSAPASLPSDADPQFTYGAPSARKAPEDARRSGGEDSKMQDLIQGRFVYEWVEQRLGEETAAGAGARGPTENKPTLAARGHALGAQKILAKAAAVEEKEQWKMKKFQKAESKVAKFMTRE